MSTAPVGHHLTWKEFLELPDDPRYHHAELLDGELLIANAATWLHQRVVNRLVIAIGTWCDAVPGRGEVTTDPPVRITDRRAYLPDVAWYADGRDRPAPGEPYLVGAPDLAIEVLSPSTRTHDQIRKRTDYARVGVREYWLIDPEEPVAYLLRRAGAEVTEFVEAAEITAEGVFSSPLLPGLEIPFSSLLP
ncbi:Uma2 family endonuclease [Pseudonocardia sp. CA-107938]|uniref:Uma2 family endonuclease n=1 Tax=Pseudonocardia sp. CA-107938 TaxID=3240021 RepID=UPI003D90E60B